MIEVRRKECLYEPCLDITLTWNDIRNAYMSKLTENQMLTIVDIILCIVKNMEIMNEF